MPRAARPSLLFKTVKVSAVKTTAGAASLPDVGVLTVYTDGSCLRNGKPDARGGYACYLPGSPDRSGGWPLSTAGGRPTNNRAEFSAFLKAVEIADALDPDAVEPGAARTLLVVTDSELLQKTVARWLPAWRKKGWRKSDGAPVANLDLCKRMADACDRRAIVVKHVRAHTDGADADSVGNRHADDLALRAAKEQRVVRL